MRNALGPSAPRDYGSGWVVGCRWRDGDAGRRSAHLGHQPDESVAAFPGVMHRHGRRISGSLPARPRATASAFQCRFETAIAWWRTAAKSAVSWRRTWCFPDDKIAIAVLTNQEASAAAGGIAGQSRCSSCLHPIRAPALRQNCSRLRHKPEKFLTGLQKGRIDRALFTASCNFYFDQTSLDDQPPGVSAARRRRDGCSRPPHRCVAA